MKITIIKYEVFMDGKEKLELKKKLRRYGGKTKGGQNNAAKEYVFGQEKKQDIKELLRGIARAVQGDSTRL